MAHACRVTERETYDELDDLFELQESEVIRSWRGRRIVHGAGCLWRADPQTRVYTTHSPSIESRNKGVSLFDAKLLVELLHRLNESARTSPDFLRSLQEYKSHELVSLLGSISEFLVEGPLDHPDESMSEHEPVAMYSLIDWRKVNHNQWQTGIRATLGEDGEVLAVWQGDPRAEHMLEDEYEEFLPD